MGSDVKLHQVIGDEERDMLSPFNSWSIALPYFVISLPYNILPKDTPVIVSTDNEWLNPYVREFISPEVPQLHLAESAVWDDPSVFDPLLEHVLQLPIDSLLIHEFIEEHEKLWYLTTPENVVFDVLVFDAAENYKIATVPITHPEYNTILVLRFRYFIYITEL